MGVPSGSPVTVMHRPEGRRGSMIVTLEPGQVLIRCSKATAEAIGSALVSVFDDKDVEPDEANDVAFMRKIGTALETGLDLFEREPR